MTPRAIIQVVSTFICSDLGDILPNNITAAGCASSVRLAMPADLTRHMLAPADESEDITGTLVLVRVEDWLRAKVANLDDKSVRRELKADLDEFVGQVSVLAMRGRPLWLVVCPSTGWISHTYNFAALCRTYTNLLAARLRNLPQVTLLGWPESISKDEFYDRERDQTNHAPFTRAAFEQLAESLARQLAPILGASDSATFTATTSVGSPELANFLSGLRVQVNLTRAQPSESADVGRILRTAASFSLSGEKPTLADSEADAIIASQECWLVRVADRLSDFGASGIVVAKAEDSAMVVESFSLTCPVLGKQVEYALLFALKEIAVARNLPTLAFQYQASGRNQPMLAFLKSIAHETNRQRFEIPVKEVQARLEKAAVAPGAWSMTRD